MKTNSWLPVSRCVASAALFLLCTAWTQAQTTNSNNLTVLGYVDVTNNIYFGTTTTNQSAVFLNYSDTNHTIGFISTKPSSAFKWQDNGIGTPKSKLLLDASNNLTLYGTNGSAGVVINPSTGGITLAGTGSGITLADGTILNNAASIQSLSPVSIDANGNLIATANSVSIDNANSVSIGNDNYVSGYGATALSFGNQAMGDYSTAIGFANDVLADYSTGIGYENNALGYSSTAFGFANNAAGYSSTAFGYSSTAGGDFSTAFGYVNNAAGYSSTAFGYYTTAGGDFSTAFGYANNAAGYDSSAFGYACTSPSFASVAFGQFNVGLVNASNGNTTWIPTDPVMEIGNGVSGAPSNAVTIFKSGKLRTEDTIESKVGVRVPPTGDLSMGAFTSGANPATLNPATGLRYPSGN